MPPEPTLSMDTISKPEDEKPGDHGRDVPQRLRGKLGTPQIVFMVIAAAAPLAVVGGNVPLAILSGNGPGAPVGFVIAAVVMFAFAVGFVTMTPYVKKPGAFYAYVQHSLGLRGGRATAYLALVTYTAIQVANYAFGGSVLHEYFKSNVSLSLPWWVYVAGYVALVAFLGYRNIDLSAKVLGVALVLEITVVAVLDIIVFSTGGKDGITADPISPSNIFTGAIAVSILFALTGFIGFESTAIYRDETLDPDRVIPRATYLALFIIGFFYAVSCWALVIAWGPSNVVEKAGENPSEFLVNTVQEYGGFVYHEIVNILIMVSIFACVLSFHNIITRYQYALALNGEYPKKFAEVHKKHKSPAFSSIVQTVTAVVILIPFVLTDADPLVNIFGTMAGVGTVGMILLLIVTSYSVFVFFKKNRSAQKSVWHCYVAPIVATVLLLVCLVLALLHFTLITGLPAAISYSLAAVPPIVLVLGFFVRPPRPRDSHQRQSSLELEG